MITMAEIDKLRDQLSWLRAYRRQCGCAICDAMVKGGEEIVEEALRRWWAQDCRDISATADYLAEEIDRLIEERNRLQADLDARRAIRTCRCPVHCPCHCPQVCHIHERTVPRP